MAAALSASEAGIKDILILERDQFLGGILNQCIHPGFGLHTFKEELTGPEYAQRFIDKVANDQNIKISLRSFVVNISSDKIITYIKPGQLATVHATAIVCATGCREKTREMIQIPGTRPAGIFPAGLAQKMINREGWLPGKEVVIIGSGDIGLIMARRLTLEGANVKAVLEIKNKTSGLIRNVVQCLEDFQIPLYLSHQVIQINGQNRVCSVSVKNLENGSIFDIPCDTVLTSVGLIPEQEIFENIKDTPGLFWCGNANKVYDLVDWVVRDSQTSGKKAAEFICAK